MSWFPVVFRVLYISKDLLERGTDLLLADGPLPLLPGGRDLVPAQATRVLPGTQDQAAPIRRCRTAVDGISIQTLRLERRPDQCEARYLDRLAPEGIFSCFGVGSHAVEGLGCQGTFSK
jgi:hypothetical protein